VTDLLGSRRRDVLFQLDAVAAERGGRAVLRDVSVEVGGGATAVVGPSGSGKSTLLRLLNRLADPTAGAVRFDGRDVRELDVLDLRRRAVLVPQLPAPLPGTVAANVAYGPSLRGAPADVERCLELAGLDGSFAERDAARLSVGEQQRLMLARALALDPEALLLDEPTAALDEDARTGVELTLVELQATLGVAIVLVTHDRAQAKRLTTRTIELRDGRVVG
jgi:putative ABC transport system ATP-binding protein